MRFFHIIITLLTISICAYGQTECTNSLMPSNAGLELGTLDGWEILSGNAIVSSDSFEGDFAIKSCGPQSGIAYDTPFFYSPGTTCVVKACGKIEGNPNKAGFGLAYFNIAGQLLMLDSIAVTSTTYECYTAVLNPPVGTFAYAVSYAIEGDGCLYLDSFCKSQFTDCNIGEPCDDQNPDTIEDQITFECLCEGSACGVNASAGNDVGILSGQPITLTAGGGTQFLWSTMETTPQITVTPTMETTYMVTVSDGMGCEDVAQVTVSIIETFSIGNLVWEDQNGDGCKDPGEPGINNISIRIFNDFGVNVTGTNSGTVAGQDGVFSFNMLPGDYYLQVLLPQGYCLSPFQNCGDMSLDSDIHEGTFQTDMFTLSEDIDHLDIGLIIKPALPLQLLGYDANMVDNETLLEWRVADEVSVKEFQIWRMSPVNGQFNLIATIPSEAKSNYFFIDKEVEFGSNYYYKLLALDFDGLTLIEQIRIVNTSDIRHDKFDLFPTLADHSIQIEFTTGSHLFNELRLDIFNSDGLSVYQKKLVIDDQSVKKSIHVSDWPADVYYAILNLGTQRIVKKWIKI